MLEIKRVSEISVNDLADYMRLSEGEYDEGEIKTFLNVAKNSISSYTGIPITAPVESPEAETLDDYPDFVIAVMITVQDLYDNRSLYVEKAELNQTVQTILNMHTRNLI